MAMASKFTHEQYKKAFDEKFDGILELRDSKYISAREPIIAYCLVHGAFERGASALLRDNRSKHVCPKCAKELQRNEVLAVLGFARASADLGTRLTSGSHSACQGYFGSNEAKDYVVNPIDNN